MNYTDVFTEKEAESLLRKSMLEYDFGHFSFKPRLLFRDYSRAMQTYFLNYDTEYQLLEVYRSNCTKSTFSFDNINFNEQVKELIVHNEGDPLTGLMLNHRSNYYIDLKNIAGFSELGVLNLPTAKKFKSTKFYQAIVTLMIACTHYDSLVPHLKWLSSDIKPSVSFTDMIDQKPLVDAVSAGNLIKTPMFSTKDVTSVPMTLNRPLMHFRALQSLESSSTATGYKVVKFLLREYLIFGSEIMNRIETIKDEEIRRILYDGIYGSGTNDISKLLYIRTPSGEVSYNPELEPIIKEADMEKRFKLISEFVANHDKDLSTAVDNYIRLGLTVSNLLSEFVKYCQNESILHIRKKTVIILYNEMKRRGLLKHLSSTSEFGLPLPGLGSTFSDDDDDEDVESESMMKDAFIDYGDGDTEPPANDDKREHSESGIAFEELDKLSTDFEADDYKFEVRTKIDTSEVSRDAYLEIANDMSLLNSNLIRSIKEIKVYNMGGKNPGKTTGKLDRKNLYKYKTSKDIFFDNTYKVKESDLAFGIILDVSGSMSGNGIRYGKATMIVLHETLKALNINHSIITHTSRRFHNCQIDKYQAFKEDKTYSCNKNYALANITAHNGNCDSASLYYMEQCMKRVKNKDKICIIFSDGEPTECSDTELVEQVRHMERNGIRVIGVGINYPKIKEYYKNNANGSNLKEMFNIVSNILKEYVLEKVDKE